jgi:ABC-type lipoprotein export system ATPase subunit
MYAKINNKEVTMTQILEFHSIELDGIFDRSFSNFKKNNEIDFANKNFAVIYAPNGVGKTSLCKVLAADSGRFQLEYDDKKHQTDDGKDLFYVIPDQNSRNIIKGETGDFILGDEIRKETELGKEIKIQSNSLSTEVSAILKQFNISKQTKIFTDLEKIRDYILEFANVRTKGKPIINDPGKLNSLAAFFNSLSVIPNLKENTIEYYKNNYNKKESQLEIFRHLDTQKIIKNANINQIKRLNDALPILNKYVGETECIVCDTTPVDYNRLLKIKQATKEAILNTLDEGIRNDVIYLLNSQDTLYPIAETILYSLESGDFAAWETLKQQILDDIKNVDSFILFSIKQIFIELDLLALIPRYNQLIARKLKPSDEDYEFIVQIVRNNIEKPIEIERDDQTNNILIKLAGGEFFGVERESLPLSSGEQNFLSLAFELLKAKNNNNSSIVIIDDPISSLDSVYKNKTIYSIVNTLHQKKKSIILTHSLDLVRLFERQYPGGYNLYMFNNVHQGNNGFVRIEDNDKNLLLNLDQVTDFFRNKMADVINQRAFLIGTLPFMRSYANIIGDTNSYGKLSDCMHGYTNKTVDIGEICNTLFSNGIKSFKIDSAQIIAFDFDFSKEKIIPSYPLFERAISHSIYYLKHRAIIEKTLVDKYNIIIKETEHRTLYSILRKAHSPENNLPDSIYASLMSKKTLLNDFAHAEFDLNLFLPALDISDYFLKKEIEQIQENVLEINSL